MCMSAMFQLFCVLNGFCHDTIVDCDEKKYGGTAHRLSPMNVPCELCGALMWIEERCCGQGKYQIQPIEPPDAIKKLFLGEHTRSKFFFKFIRSLNSNFAFASMVVEEDHLKQLDPQLSDFMDTCITCWDPSAQRRGCPVSCQFIFMTLWLN